MGMFFPQIMRFILAIKPILVSKTGRAALNSIPETTSIFHFPLSTLLNTIKHLFILNASTHCPTITSYIITITSYIITFHTTSYKQVSKFRSPLHTYNLYQCQPMVIFPLLQCPQHPIPLLLQLLKFLQILQKQYSTDKCKCHNIIYVCTSQYMYMTMMIPIYTCTYDNDDTYMYMYMYI